MKEILFLAHRIPYPPNKGDKIRSFHLLKYLSESYRVHLGAFVDDPDDWRYVSEVEKFCGETRLLPLQPGRSKLKSLKGLATRLPLTVPYYADTRMGTWVDGILNERPIHAALVFSSAMAQYVADYDSLPRIIDFVDVDSDKWRQYAARKNWPMSWIYRREADCLVRYERKIANAFSRSAFVSENEAALFRSLAPEANDRILSIENGVDTAYFADRADYVNPYSPDELVMVFTGAMDYWANVDAVTWFANEIFPEIRRQLGSARFYIVGARPTESVRTLAQTEGVKVTGAVEDVRPFLKHARCVVTPLRIARGVQNKVLEAMAMGKSILSSEAAVEGIDVVDRLDLIVPKTPGDWVELGLNVLGADDFLPRESEKNRRFIMQRYGWEMSLHRLGTLLDSL
ncbi:glycosyl transferase, group 1 [Methylocaldum marinum]|uniref:Glycosyl transferase, group 1 n=1 Tax=Methylocaldum marinum TaxID=1432792 RepID=A0A286P433_9GAMM|nr:TIGR03087 family PEP-CTERM/XrtA system glycosyltransferase [Methylocaldum marinum]BBA32405.1 glycosyl transferase, group 1 [Methylocaldum marinum]